MLVTDELWSKIENLIPAPKKAPNGAGRPAYPRRQILDGILWVLMSGARWKDLPSEYPGYKTCHRLFQNWQSQGIFEEIFHILSSEKSNEEVKIAYIDGTFVPAKKGGLRSGEVIKARAAQSWPSAMGLVGLLDSVSTAQINTKPSA